MPSAGRSGNINTNNHRREVGPDQAVAVGPSEVVVLNLDKPGKPQPEWAQIMATRRRKTLVVCEACHASIHGKPTASNTE